MTRRPADLARQAKARAATWASANGCLSREQMAELVRSGQIKPEDVQRAGMEAWQREKARK